MNTIEKFFQDDFSEKKGSSQFNIKHQPVTCGKALRGVLSNMQPVETKTVPVVKQVPLDQPD